VRVITVPQRDPSVLGRVVAPHRRTPVRTKHEREQIGLEGDRLHVGHAREYEAALKHAQVLRSSGRHRRASSLSIVH
jgi:hypothetical protein